MGAGGEQGKDPILSIYGDVDLGDQNEALAGNILHELLDLRTGEAELFENMGEIDISDIAQDWKKALEIPVDLLHFQRLIGEIGRCDGIPEIKEAQINNIGPIEEIFDLHATLFRFGFLSCFDPAATVLVSP